VWRLATDRSKKPFLQARLTRLGLILFTLTIVAPWIVVGSSYIWPFMAFLQWKGGHTGWAYFGDFWLGNLPKGYAFSQHAGEGLSRVYFGWVLVLVCQFATLLLWIMQLIKPQFLSKKLYIAGLILFPLSSLLLGVYQWYIHMNIQYLSYAHSDVFPYFGLWIAGICEALLLISLFRSPEWAARKRYGKKRIILGTLLIFIALFFLVNEIEFQTKVTKFLYVQKNVENTELPGDPKVWEADFARILAVAYLFRARVFDNDPNYYYCELEVPVVSYASLKAIYIAMGYGVQEGTFLTVGPFLKDAFAPEGAPSLLDR